MRSIILLFFVYQVFVNAESERRLDEDSFASEINGFSLDFTKKLDFKTENILFSPLGLAMSIGMILNGAEDETKESLFKMLNMDELSNKNEVHNLFKTTLNEYKGMATREKDPRNATVEISNLAVYAEQYNLSEAFIDTLKNYYEANVAKEDFAKNGPQIKEKLNKFVKERTHDLIPELFKEPLNPSTIMLIMNTIYFKGFWEHYFTKPTIKEKFYSVDKSENNIDMMSMKAGQFNYSHSEKHKAAVIELPYKGSISMIIILPEEKYGLSELLQNVSKEELEVLIDGTSNQRVEVHLPKFTYEHEIDLIVAFEKMGVNIVNALKSLDKALRISQATHTAKIQVDEAGTVAAAVTIFHINRIIPAPPPLQPIIFKVDHPFAFYIRDMKSKVNLFAGVVNKLK